MLHLLFFFAAEWARGPRPSYAYPCASCRSFFFRLASPRSRISPSSTAALIAANREARRCRTRWRWRRTSVIYEGGLSISLSAVISMQPLGIEQANNPHMKAKDVPFHMGYGGLICSKALLSDEPKWGGRYADPRWMTVWKTVGKTMLDWGENRRCPRSLPIIWMFLWVENAIIPHLKEEIQGYLLI